MLRNNEEGADAVQFDIMAYMAPGMALLFLMYTVSYGGRSILLERSQGTLPRLLVSPTSSTQVLGGKVIGIFLTGVAQVGILILASALFFGVRWGDPLGVAVLILATVFGATGWGMLITAMARTPGPGRKRRFGDHADLRHPGRQLHQLGADAAFYPGFEQNHPQRLGAGWFHHAGPGRHIWRTWGSRSLPC